MEESIIYPLPDRAWIDVNRDALRRNAVTLMEQTSLPLIPMIKADAYGVGADGVVETLEPLDPLAYGVASVTEGEHLRAIGIARPIVVFTPILRSEFARAQACDLTAALGDAASIGEWAPSGRPYQLAIDTGMNRAGLSWRDVSTVHEVVRRWPPAAAFTHFHSAELDDGSVDIQIARFFQAIRELGVDIPLLHADNSAAAARAIDGQGRWGAVRPGMFLYGVGSHAGIDPVPAVSLRARVVDIRWIEPGDTVSYDAVYTAPRRERIATATIGYGDGYPRALSGRAVATVNGVRVPQRGLVTMDMTMFDVTDAACDVGDVVTLFGESADPELRIEGVASLAGMSPYELLTGLAPRLIRRFNDR
ncbi:MAG: alanine racemase [Gemmatimonadaceae bacterium]